MSENGSESKDLTVRQRRAVVALLGTRNHSEAAKAAKVGESTLYRWMEQPAFLDALQEAESQAIDRATRRLIGLQDEAISTLAGILGDEEASSTVRLRAARTILDYLIRLRELRSLEERLSALEELAEKSREPVG